MNIETENFPKIFILNLPQASSRKIHMQSMLSKFNNINYEFIDAVVGSDLSFDELNALYDDKKSNELLSRSLTKGEIGCALTHLKIYKKIVDEKIDEAVILEDDITICENFIKIINQKKYFPLNWEIILLGHGDSRVTKRGGYTHFFKKYKLSPEYKLARFVSIAYGTVGYIINYKGAKKLLEKIEKVYMPIDHFTGNSTLINLYGLEPICIEEDSYFGENSFISDDRIKGQRSRGIYYIITEKLRRSKIKHYLKFIYFLPKRVLIPKEYKS